MSNDIRKLLTKHREKAAYDSAVAELTHQLKSDSNSEHDSFTKSEQNIQFNASWLEQDGFLAHIAKCQTIGLLIYMS